VADALDALWDFDDPAASERRFRERLASTDGEERLAPRVRVRYLLERGRAFRSAGRPADALPLFVQASELAASTHESASAQRDRTRCFSSRARKTGPFSYCSGFGRYLNARPYFAAYCVAILAASLRSTPRRMSPAASP